MLGIEMRRYTIQTKLFIGLLGLSMVSVVAVLPYVFNVQRDTLTHLPIPLHILLVAQLAQSLVLFSLAIVLGLRLSRSVGFELPFFTAWLTGSLQLKQWRSKIGQSLLAGSLVAVGLWIIDGWFTRLGLGISTHAPLTPAWQTLLAALYGGITEELLLRLFLMSLLVWVGMKIRRASSPSSGSIWLANIMAAVIFGLGHLPITAAVTQITTLVVVRAVVLNGLAGVMFGWLYWKKGLEMAMLAHFSADVWLLTLLPLLVRWL